MTTKKVSTKKAIIECSEKLIAQLINKNVIDDIDFDLKTRRLHIELSTKAYGDGWDFYAEYNRKTKSLGVSSARYERVFREFVDKLYTKCTNIKDIEFHFYGD